MSTDKATAIIDLIRSTQLDLYAAFYSATRGDAVNLDWKSKSDRKKRWKSLKAIAEITAQCELIRDLAAKASSLLNK
jgi:hypothetical protein